MTDQPAADRQLAPSANGARDAERRFAWVHWAAGVAVTAMICFAGLALWAWFIDPYEAIRSKSYNKLKLILFFYGDFIIEPDQQDPLEYSVLCDDKDAIKQIMRHRSHAPAGNPNAALFYAVSLGRLDCIYELILHGQEINSQYDGNSPLIISLSFRDDTVLEFLVHRGADPNYMVQGRTALHAALSTWRHDKAERLLKLGADPNIRDAWGYPPLWYAVHSNSLEAVKTILDGGAIVDSVLTDNGVTCLHEAIYRTGNLEHNMDMVVMLVENGANVNAQASYGITPFIISGMASPEAILYLASSGADIHHRTIRGNSALHYAIRYSNNVNNLQTLIDLGLNINDEGTYGFTPLDVAIYRNKFHLIAYLVEQGALTAGEVRALRDAEKGARAEAD